MSVASPTKRRGTRSEVDTAADRVPEKHEEGNPSSIAELAYRIYEERGRQEGHQLEDWLEAERRMSARQLPAQGPTSTESAAVGFDPSATTGAELPDRDRVRQSTNQPRPVKQRRV